MKYSRIFMMCLLSALLAVGLVTGYKAVAAYLTLSSGPVYNTGYMATYLQQMRGAKMVAAVAGSESDGATTTVTGMEVGDVIIDVVNHNAAGITVENIDESAYTAAAGGAVIDTGVTTAPTAADNLIFFFIDIDNVIGQ